MFAGFLAAALVLVASPTPRLSANEQRYIEARDAATTRFVKGEGPWDAEQRVTDDLRARLREIVGPVRVPGLTGPGTLAYAGFWGVGSTPIMADGMVFDWNDDRLFVTTRALYTRWVRTLRNVDPRSLGDEVVARTVFGGDVAFATFAELPVRMGASTRRGRAVVGLAGQAYGSWPPNCLIVQVERGDRVFVVSASLDPPMEQVAACEARFKADESKIPRGEAGHGLEERAFDAYRRCVGPKLPTRPSHAAVLGRAQAIVDRLEAGDGGGAPAGR